MILVVGGRASGKRSYVLSLGYSAHDMADGFINDKPVVLNLQEALREDRRSPEEIAAALADKQVICCCEVGSGVVPMNPDDNAWRERVGRSCNLLAERAEVVVRMVCGIPLVLKGEAR